MSDESSSGGKSGDRYWSIRNIGSIDKQESPKIHQSQSMRRKGDKPERATDQSLAAASRSRLSVIANCYRRYVGQQIYDFAIIRADSYLHIHLMLHIIATTSDLSVTKWIDFGAMQIRCHRRATWTPYVRDLRQKTSGSQEITAVICCDLEV